MLDCIILGDSIAVGVGQARPACTTVARTGITSTAYVQTLLPTAPRAAASAIISLGVNDDASVATLDNLRHLRRSVTATHVTWLLPGLKDDIRRHIRAVAQENGDRTLDTAPEAGPDRLHPTGQGYRVIASWTEQGAPARPSPHLVAMNPGPPRPGSAMLPRIHTPATMPSLYATWPPPGTAFAAIPPRDFAYRAFTPSLPRPVLR